MKTYIGKLGSLGKFNDIERLENRSAFFKMINFNSILGLRDYVNQNAASDQNREVDSRERLSAYRSEAVA